MNIIKKVVGENKRSSDRKIKYSLWEDQITTNTSTGKTLLELVYGLEAKLFVNLQIHILCFAQQYTAEGEAIQGIINQLVELDDFMRDSLSQMERNHEKVKNTFYHKEKERVFTEGYLMFLWDKRREKLGMHKRLDGLWKGPYKVMIQEGTNLFNLATLE